MPSDPEVLNAEKPLIDWLLKEFPDTPKSRAKQWIMAGRVSVNGEVIRKPHQAMRDPGEGLSLGDRHATTLACGTGWKIHPRVTLLHLDSALAIVNKGPGLIAVPAANADLSALSILADFLAGDLKARDRNVAGKSLPASFRSLEPLPVHRLDQYTSGVFCIAMSTAARHSLIEQLKVHSMSREYVAFVQGRSPVRKGTWRHWLKLTRDELRQQVVPGAGVQCSDPEAQEAITHFEVAGEYTLHDGTGFITKLRLKLETGRKHQIRVQAAHSGLPLIGDRAYNPAYRGREDGEMLIDFPRQALHAEVLTLEHPDHPGKRMSWAAEMPKDLNQLQNSLRSTRYQSK
jgi:23S rRNA pseudouridine1911/1915/1917 synthase